MPDAPKWTVTAWHCSCHAVNWYRRHWSAPGRPPAPGVPPGVVGGLFSYNTVDEFLGDGHKDLVPVDVDDVAALLADLALSQFTLALTESERRNYRENIEWLRAALSAAKAERDRRGDELRRAQTVVDAAKAWYAACDPRAITAAGIRLAAAVDALEAPVPP